jgi:hypothetical protein
MDDQLDNDLKKRIREVFDKYHDEHADEGWLLLRQKYPEKARRRPMVWLWWSSAAAVLLLFVGILLYNNASKKENKIVANKPGTNHPILKSIEPQKNNYVGSDKNKDDNASADSVISSLQAQALADQQVSSNRLHKPNIATTNRQIAGVEKSNKIAGNNAIGDNATIANNRLPVKDNYGQSVAVTNPLNEPAGQAIVVSKADNIKKTDSAVNIKSIAADATTHPNSINIQDQAKKTDKALFADNKLPKNEKTKNSSYAGRRAVSFGVYATTYVNYAKGSNNQVNGGIGISSDIRISKKLNLSTGVVIAQNSLSYGSQLPPEQSRLLNASSNSYTASANALAAPAYNKNSFFAATPALKNYNANLVDLDVPINLKYQFNPEKSATFVSIGVSSGTFINERYTSTYNYITPFASNLSQTTDQSLRQSFNSFYFARTVNFSFGTGYRIAGNDLIIEPFIKYPLEGLGSQQIKFGSGGVNLKFSFPTKRK